MHNIAAINGEQFKNALKAGFASLQKYKEQINALNVFPVPDGDTGTNMYLTVASAAREMENAEDNRVSTLAKAASKGALMGARGNSGVILSQLFRGFSVELADKAIVESSDLVRAADKAVSMAYKAVLKPVEGTILTVAKAVALGIKESSYESKNIRFLIEEGIREGEKTLARTPEILDVLKKAGVVDAGGKGLMIILQGVAGYLDGKDVDEMDIQEIPPVVVNFNQHEEIGAYLYCTECFIKGNNLDERDVLSSIQNLGDSTLVVGDKQLIKIHIHTNHPGRVLEAGLGFGTLHDIKIENMLEQHQNIVKEKKPTGVVAVAAGEGLRKIMESMGVDYTVEGGQTMNPSTEDLLSAINRVNADNVLVLPNNSNIILAAQQAAKLSKKSVRVVPTKSFPQGMAALLGYDQSIDAQANFEHMMEHFKGVITGEITFAVRDTSFGDIEIKVGDILAIVDGNITNTGADVEQVTTTLIEGLIDKAEIELVTLFYGKDVLLEDAEKLQKQLTEDYPEVEFELYQGGQPLYHYIISAE